MLPLICLYTGIYLQSWMVPMMGTGPETQFLTQCWSGRVRSPQHQSSGPDVPRMASDLCSLAVASSIGLPKHRGVALFLGKTFTPGLSPEGWLQFKNAVTLYLENQKSGPCCPGSPFILPHLDYYLLGTDGGVIWPACGNLVPSCGSCFCANVTLQSKVPSGTPSLPPGSK